jgi:demethylmenaquinone methyltransferase/2-methoxy-6-polyprenyl-1,4-benzoquinol methylase
MTRTAEPTDLPDDERQAAVTAMFARIAPIYDSANGWLSLGRHRAWRARAVRTLGLAAGGAALDVCCGTGEFLPLLRSAVGETGRVVGLDLCQPMLDQAAGRAASTELLVGDACSLPFAEGEFDGLTIGWGLRNVANLPAALQEARRVLRPGGRIATLDMVRQAKPLQSGVRAVTSLVGAAFGQREAYQYLDRSAAGFLSAEGLARAMESAGFDAVGFRRLALGAVALHWGRA